MNSLARVAVIMSTYAERPEWLRESIESILGQTFSDYRFYVVLDNPDNDQLAEIAREYAEKDHRIVVIENERNMGLVGSLNLAISLSDEPLIARMDADDVSYPQRLEREVLFLDAHDMDFVMSGVDILSEGKITPGRALPDLFTEEISLVEKHMNVAFHPTWLLKREVYEMLGSYREIDACEDYDLVVRALQHGFKLGRISETLVAYRLVETGISYSKWATQERIAEGIRRAYRNGQSVDAISPRTLNHLGEGLSEVERVGYAQAKNHYDALFMMVGNKKYLQAVGILCRGLMNRIFRKKMRNAVMERIVIRRACH